MIERISTAWSPYAVTFSHDGTRLAIGGGTWYGLGGIVLIDLRTRQRVDLQLSEVEQSLQGGSISGLAFTADDRHLLASAWVSGHRGGHAFVFEIEGLHGELVMRHPHAHRHGLTGIHAHGGGAALRVWNAIAAGSLEVLPWPRELGIDPSPGRPELTSHRLVVAHGHAVTGNHGAHGGPAPTPPLQPSLLVRSLGDGATTSVLAGNAAITAIGATGDTLIAGNATGALTSFAWRDRRPVLDRLLGTIATATHDSALWAVYQPTAVVGICALGTGAAAVTAGGTLAIWRPGEDLASWPISPRGTPRTIAASPDRSLLAVGVKSNRGAELESAVLLIEVEPDELERAWRTPRARQMARAADEHRTSSGALDPMTLGVLADALEEAGATPRVLGHLRDHDRRLRTCWVVDRLRDETVLPSA